ncbi:MAG: retroviral-like aspartic protease family protein [bacterium]
MGKVVIKALLSNNQDLTRLADGRIVVDQVRQQEQELIVDTGARAVGLPLSIIEQLGLPATRKVTVTLSDGSRQERQLYGELRVQVGDRDDVFSCVAKPEGAPLLLGQLVLEALDLVVDCGQQRLIPNPEAPDGMMLYEDY